MADTNVNMLDFGTGRPVDLDRLDELCSSRKVDRVAIVHHETTTGLLNPLGVVLQITAAHGCKLVVDAVSSVGAHPVDVDTEAVCFNSSKCLESLPGIGIVAWKSGLPVHTIFGVLDVGAYAEGMPTIPNGLFGLATMPGLPPNGLALSDHVRAEQVELDFPIAARNDDLKVRSGRR